MRIYVGNLSYQATEETLTELFKQYGEVTEVRVITDRDTGRSRGFAFVEMPNEAEARAAIEALDQKETDGRTLRVNEAQPRRQDRRDSGPRGGGGGGGGRDAW